MKEEKSKAEKPQIYLKALPLRDREEVEDIKKDISSNFIVILRITPLAQKNVEELKKAVEELYNYTISIGGDIARLGDERVVITPPGVKIWRGLLNTP
jgi:SepF-like predicted cell division protein (DUF552 family)